MCKRVVCNCAYVQGYDDVLGGSSVVVEDLQLAIGLRRAKLNLLQRQMTGAKREIKAVIEEAKSEFIESTAQSQQHQCQKCPFAHIAPHVVIVILLYCYFVVLLFYCIVIACVQARTTGHTFCSVD
jgi:hypothetical protein